MYMQQLVIEKMQQMLIVLSSLQELYFVLLACIPTAKTYL